MFTPEFFLMGVPRKLMPLKLKLHFGKTSMGSRSVDISELRLYVLLHGRNFDWRDGLGLLQSCPAISTSLYLDPPLSWHNPSGPGKFPIPLIHSSHLVPKFIYKNNFRKEKKINFGKIPHKNFCTFKGMTVICYCPIRDNHIVFQLPYSLQ